MQHKRGSNEKFFEFRCAPEHLMISHFLISFASENPWDSNGEGCVDISVCVAPKSYVLTLLLAQFLCSLFATGCTNKLCFQIVWSLRNKSNNSKQSENIVKFLSQVSLFFCFVFPTWNIIEIVLSTIMIILISQETLARSYSCRFTSTPAGPISFSR